MKFFMVFNIILIYSILIKQTNGAKILSIFGYPGPSQYIVASALLKALAEQGHEVTSISTFPQEKPIKNFRDIAVMENSNLYDATMSAVIKKDQTEGFFAEFRKYSITAAKMVTNVLENPQVKAIMKNEQFDLLILEIFMNEALFGLAEHFKAPIVGVSSLGTMNFIDHAVGNISPSSYIPHFSLPFDNNMSFKQRFWNFLITVCDEFHYKYAILPMQQKIYQKYFPTTSLTFDQVQKNISLVLLNQHFSLSFPRPYVPNMIEVGGLHIKQHPDPLPQDLQAQLDNATEGAIYFSMGSNLKSKDLPAQTLATILDTFRELKIKVFWKFELESLANKPDNVFIKSWYPQPSVLAHPNVKLFISHGGFLSTTETIFHAKPVLGMPVFFDQYSNVQNAVRAGYALSLNLENITKESFKNAIVELLTNDHYTKTVQKLSKRFRDQTHTPLEKAVYWTEYVLRHEGAVHMRNAGMNLNYWEYHNVDVFAILIGGFVFVVLMLILVLRFLKMLICGKKLKKKSNKIKRS